MNKNLFVLLYFSMFVTIIIVMSLVPFLGYIPFTPSIRATTLHIPVIIGAIMLGPKLGGLLGLVFGITSLISNTFTPTITSFVFTPFYQVGDLGGNGFSLLICFLPRLAIGLSSGVVFQQLMKYTNNKILSCFMSAIIGSLIHTILVLVGIYFFFGTQYAQIKQFSPEILLPFLGSVIAVNGVLEAFTAGIIVTMVSTTLLKLPSKR